jgi:ribosomal protein S18 acetylase RimI-like enzyme
MHSKFRAARPADAPDLVCLIDSATRGMSLWFWSRLRSPGQAVLEAGRNRVLNETASPLHYTSFTIAEVDGLVVGGLSGRLIPVPYARADAEDLPAVLAPYLELESLAAGSWYVNLLAIYPEYRGRGLGSAVLEHAENRARQSAAPRLTLIVEDANRGAHQLYLRSGFEELARRPYLPFPGSTDRGDWVLLKKEIS